MGAGLDIQRAVGWQGQGAEIRQAHHRLS